jgi:hypothetical protein
MDAGAIQEHLELLQFDLAPLLVMKAPRGFSVAVISMWKPATRPARFAPSSPG